MPWTRLAGAGQAGEAAGGGAATATEAGAAVRGHLPRHVTRGILMIFYCVRLRLPLVVNAQGASIDLILYVGGGYTSLHLKVTRYH